ncbi:CRP/FNR family cyclic AMP-dependent transcriptional regulator [Clostridiales Family XIII bacterium PM5-7]
MMSIREVCREIEILTCSKPSTTTSLISCGILRRYKKGERVFMEREQVGCVYFLAEGTAAIYKVNQQQDKKVIFICGKGELLSITVLPSILTASECEMLTDGLILSFPSAQFKALMAADPWLSERIMEDMAKKIGRLYRQLANTTNTTLIDQQIAAKLWKLARDHGVPTDEGIEIGFNLPITYLADLVGSTRETVSRQVKRLMEKELIQWSKNRFVIKDMDQLANYSKET